MIDRGNMYRREPKVIRDSEGLLKVLSDRNGNEFNADSRDVGSELIVDYPPFARRIEVYVVGMNVQGKKNGDL